MTIDIKITGADKVQQKLSRYPNALDREMASIVRGFASDLLEASINHASGRPGPQIVTGDYVAHMRGVVEIHSNKFVAYAANSAPQAHRLEFGFYGVDSLGRVYHQGPFPHMRPALYETVDKWMPVIHEAPIKVWEAL